MSAVWHIARIELRRYLSTWTSWVLAATFFGLTAFLFQELLQQFQHQRLRYAERGALAVLAQMNLTDLVVTPTFSYVATFFVFLLPVLTMRLAAADRRDGMLELLHALPVRTVEIVIGKYLAAWVVMVGMLALTTVFPIGLHLFAAADPRAVDGGTLVAAYLGLALLGSAGVAVGLAASAVAPSQLVAVVLGFVVLALLLMVGIAAEAESGPWRALLVEISMSHHLRGFTGGLVRLGDVTYYLAVTFLGLFAAHRGLARGGRP